MLDTAWNLGRLGVDKGWSGLYIHKAPDTARIFKPASIYF